MRKSYRTVTFSILSSMLEYLVMMLAGRQEYLVVMLMWKKVLRPHDGAGVAADPYDDIPGQHLCPIIKEPPSNEVHFNVSNAFPTKAQQVNIGDTFMVNSLKSNSLISRHKQPPTSASMIYNFRLHKLSWGQRNQASMLILLRESWKPYSISCASWRLLLWIGRHISALAAK